MYPDHREDMQQTHRQPRTSQNTIKVKQQALSSSAMWLQN